MHALFAPKWQGPSHALSTDDANASVKQARDQEHTEGLFALLPRNIA
jgi:hypothetical protein